MRVSLLQVLQVDEAADKLHASHGPGGGRRNSSSFLVLSMARPKARHINPSHRIPRSLLSLSLSLSLLTQAESQTHQPLPPHPQVTLYII